MQEPLQAEVPGTPDSTTDHTEYTPQQKLAVAVGVAAIGAYIGYSLMQSYREEPSQALWTNARRPTPTASTTAHAVPRIAIVNVREDVRALAKEGLRGWLDLQEEVQLTFPTVMLVEEEETSTLADIASDVRRATLFAHQELRDTQAKQQQQQPPLSQPPSSPLPQLCTVVYRCVTEVEGQPLEDWDVEAAALRRWNGKPFVQRHCLGFTVDGHNVTLLTHDVEGVLLTAKNTTTAAAATSPPKAVLHDGASLLRECAAPSTATFRTWWPPSLGRSGTAASASMATVETATKEEKTDALKVFVRTGRPIALWRGPFTLFSLLGTVLRYNRPHAAVYPRLLLLTATSADVSAAKTSGLWSTIKGWWPQRISLPPLHRRRDGEMTHGERRTLLSAPFLLIVKAAEGSVAPSTEAMKEVQSCTVRWVRHFATVTPKHEATLVEVQREKGGQWGLRVDLTRVSSTVVAAAWLMSHVAGLLAAVGVSLVNVRLVAVPPPPPVKAASLLYPTPESGSVQHYWKPSKSSPLKSAAGGGGAKLTAATTAATAPAAAQHPGWIQLELRGEKRIGFVVAQHDFASV